MAKVSPWILRVITFYIFVIMVLLLQACYYVPQHACAVCNVAITHIRVLLLRCLDINTVTNIQMNAKIVSYCYLLLGINKEDASQHIRQ